MNSPNQNKGVNIEPILRILIHTQGAPILVPLGEYAMEGDNQRVTYRQLSPTSQMIVENMVIGIGFHWQQEMSSRFDGDFEVVRDSAGNWHCYNLISLERYIASVISSEMNPEAPISFLKAHAVISRGWALMGYLSYKQGCKVSKESEPSNSKNIETIITWEDCGDHFDCDFCNDDHCQRYQGLGVIGNIHPRVIEAIEATRGMALVDSNGSIADTRFSKCCGGHTELFSSCWQDIDYDYLPGKEDPWCDLTKLEDAEREDILSHCFKDYDKATANSQGWELQIDTQGLATEILRKYKFNIGKSALIINPLKRGVSGRIIELEIKGLEGTLRLGKELAIRRLLGEPCLRSSAIEIFQEESPDSNSILVRSLEERPTAWGHGVGLCQTGAAVMAWKGASELEILQFYFPHTKLNKFYE